MADATLALAQARELAASFLSGLRRQDLAAMVLAGGGDDFPEVLTAYALFEAQAARSERHEEALNAYADAGFWDEELPGGSLASHDRGEMARNVLAGRPAFYHGD
ncbi:MAG: hypothetical protein JWQ16_1133 [Novosphingobium sp.]|nr:hypothetical protein [Novosphingobium sp.]